jgi:hypothetical protein
MNNFKAVFVKGFSKLIIYKILPLLWPTLNKIFRLLSTQSHYIPPKSKVFTSALLMTNKSGVKLYQGINLTDSAEGWLKTSQGIKKVNLVSEYIYSKEDLIVVSTNYFKHKNLHLKCFIPIILLAIKIRTKNRPVWVMMGDSFLLKSAIPACILVSICGGSIILQSSTMSEAKRFGLIYPAGPYIWTINYKNKHLFESKLSWENKDNLAIFAVSGDEIRKDIYLNYRKKLRLQNFEVIGTDGSIGWDDYCYIISCAKININTSLTKKLMLVKSGSLKDLLPRTYVTGRIFEGFCSGAVVITNANQVLLNLGFIENLDYLDLDELIMNNFELPHNDILKEIARSGNEKFNTIVAPMDKN